MQGVPDAVRHQLLQQITAAALRKGVVIVDDSSVATDVSLHGYLLADMSGGSSKIVYVWDVIDKAGQRLNRLAGEEMTPTMAPADKWAAVGPAVLARIADQAVTSLSVTTSQTAAPPAGTGAATVGRMGGN